ncbi:SPOR domain-containing protein [Photobacterium sp. SDRW27]|uniref:SPOR domain-containing protein n=1 Tax=Photobacterium obscurum TaxID=2829490 RepID=UPI002244D2B3|nr:SPOR domain-containing protein [Photobacterium obscurum]MCW8329416.1 SPOR domain-containing protein [Photobacterium obscurum]
MKKVAVLAVVAALAGCASDSDNMQIITSSSEETYTEEQLSSMEQIREAKETQPVVALKEEVVEPQPVKQVVKQEPKKQPPKQQLKQQPKKPAYKYAKTASEGYTIQVLALSHNKGFTPYINKLPSDQPVWMNKKELQGLPWYTLLFGHYDTREEAKRALNALPRDVKNYGPFIRSLDEIKSSPSPKLTKLY